MMELNLNGSWQLRKEPIGVGVSEFKRIRDTQTGWIDSPVPGDIRQGLIVARQMKEPLIGLNSLDGHWVEDHSWWFRYIFKITAKDQFDYAEIEINGLDVNASIFLNDCHLGDHPSAFRPFKQEIKSKLRRGKNVLLVRLTHGLENVTAAQVNDLGGNIGVQESLGRPERGDRRRPFVRKPQYSWGWDWSPRTATIGITGDVKIRFIDKAAIRDIQIEPTKHNKQVVLAVTPNVEWLNPFQSGVGKLRVLIKDTQGKLVADETQTVHLQTGFNYIDFKFNIKNPRLWWPADLGSQDRYEVIVNLTVDRKLVDRQVLAYGIRFIHLETNDSFALIINDKKIFCKGANWIPPDAVYSRVTDDKVNQLVHQAKLANFNMLRVWGGGLYERDAFYEACDREGILVWQDFMFACAPYPDYLEDFRDEIAKEADYQTKRLRTHCCLTLWCGGNETVSFQAPEFDIQTDNGRLVWGRILPQAVRGNCPSIPYWYCSPYGMDDHYNCRNVKSAGDCHFWHDAMSHKDIAKRVNPEIYDTCQAMFVSEYGYLGPCCEESTREYLGGAPLTRDGQAWQHHSNTFEKDTVIAGIAKHYTDTSKLSTHEYLLYGGLVQGLMYEYSLDSLRAKTACNGALFWMYNDSWGEIGWSIIDYYLRRKISWYFVRRALSPQRLILRNKKDTVTITAINDTIKPWRGILEFGYISTDGKIVRSHRKDFSLAGATRDIVATCSRDAHNAKCGLWFARAVGQPEVWPGILRISPRKLRMRLPSLSVEVLGAGADKYSVIVKSDVYAHAVNLCVPPETVPEDNYFDLLPGESREVLIHSREKLSNANITAKSIIN